MKLETSMLMIECCWTYQRVPVLAVECPIKGLLEVNNDSLPGHKVGATYNDAKRIGNMYNAGALCRSMGRTKKTHAVCSPSTTLRVCVSAIVVEESMSLLIGLEVDSSKGRSFARVGRDMVPKRYFASRH